MDIHEQHVGPPALCDFCREPTAADDLEPEESDLWACPACWARFRKEDEDARLRDTSLRLRMPRGEDS